MGWAPRLLTSLRTVATQPPATPPPLVGSQAGFSQTSQGASLGAKQPSGGGGNDLAGVFCIIKGGTAS